jgi:hypothetical protein
MWTFFISFILFFLALIAMAIGIILGGKYIRGTCGGIAHITGIESDCEACTKQCDKHTDQL